MGDGDPEDDELARLRRTERRLRALQRTTRDLMVATSREEIADAALRACREAFDRPIASLWHYSPGEDALVLVEQTEESDGVVDSPGAFERGEGLVWEVYEEGVVRAFDDLHDRSGTYNPETPLRSELMAPLGEYGILLAASRQPASFDDLDMDMGQILAATVETAFERLERERTLRDRRRDLELLRQILSRLLRHNLRNETTLVRGQADRILDAADALEDADDREALDEIRASAESIREAATTLDDWSAKAGRVGQLVDGDPDVRSLELRSVVEEALAGLDVPPDASVDLSVPPGTSVLAVPQLARAVENLVENALVHGGPAPTVEVSATRTGDSVELVVADDGPGIPPEEVAVLEAGEETPLKHGSGVGLWLVQWVVGRSDGEFRLERADGTRAVVRVPAATDPDERR